MTSTPPRPQPQRQPPVRVQRTSQPPVPALQTEESVPDIKSLGLSFEHKAPNRVDVTPAQAKAWDETRTALLWGSPAFSHILYTMMGEGGPTGAYFTNEIPIAACDDKFLFLNPEAYFRYNLGERVFIAGHEIIHAIMAHCGQLKRHERRGKISYPDGVTLPFDVNLFNQSLDYIVNDLLVESRVGTKPADCFHDKSIATGNDSAIEVFRRLYEDQEIQSKGGGDKGQDNGKGRGKGFDEHLQPGSGEGKNPTQAEQDRNSSEWSTAVAAAMHSAKVQGKLPAAMEEFFKHLLEPQISWAEKIEAFFARKVGNQTRGRSWTDS